MPLHRLRQNRARRPTGRRNETGGTRLMATVDKLGKSGKQQKYKVIGTRPIRHDGVDKVTGRAKYGADIQLTGMLHARVLRSTVAHGRIVRIDTSKAAALDGVKAVVTGKDLPALADKIEDLG